MELIVAVYDDWGIGKDGTQPVALSADRKFFRETTRGAMVIAGRKTVEDFPGKKPLPGRVNVARTRSDMEIPGFEVLHSPEEAMELTKDHAKVMVIGGGWGGAQVIREIQAGRYGDCTAVLALDDDPSRCNGRIGRVPVRMGTERAGEYARQYKIDDIIIKNDSPKTEPISRKFIKLLLIPSPKCLTTSTG